jgi:hypothetical protein
MWLSRGQNCKFNTPERISQLKWDVSEGLSEKFNRVVTKTAQNAALLLFAGVCRTAPMQKYVSGLSD